MSYYESVFIARQDLSATQVEGLADDFSKIIEEQGGKVVKRESWGLRSLAYKIKKNRKGHYTLFDLDAPSEAILEMERQMRIHDDVLRYLTIRMDELDPEPSIIMQRSSRDERPPRRREGSPDDKRPETREVRTDSAAPKAPVEEKAPEAKTDSEAVKAPAAEGDTP